eukprot:c20765_g1_i1.p1 GENE.c20765_g1_i1~~c20765_g1_i1.p1  ORF type:complete len:791 (+),score=284.46 c20765_g1_i1:55-2427(+)
MKEFIVLLVLLFFGNCYCKSNCNRLKQLREGGSTLAPSSYIPQCEPDGYFSPIQCSVGLGVCWCSTRRGHEVPNTRIAMSFVSIMNCMNTYLDTDDSNSISPVLNDKLSPKVEIKTSVDEQKKKAKNPVAALAFDLLKSKPPMSVKFAGDDKILFLKQVNKPQIGAHQVFSIELHGKIEEVEKTEPITQETKSIEGMIPRPQHSEEIVIVMDEEGNEVYQLYLYNMITKNKVQITEHKHHKHAFGSFSPCGSKMSYLRIETHDDIVTSYVVIYDFETKKSSDVYKYVDPISIDIGPFSYDLAYLAISVASHVSVMDDDIEILDINRKTTFLVTPHDSLNNPTSISLSGARFHPQTNSLYVLSNEGIEFSALQVININSKTREMIMGFEDRDITAISINPSFRVMAISVEKEGYGEYHCYSISEDGRTFTEIKTELDKEKLLPHVLMVSPSGENLLFIKETVTQEPDIVLISLENGGTVKTLLKSKKISREIMDLPEPEFGKYSSYGGLEIPYFRLPPKKRNPDERSPYIVLIHGGPKSHAGPRLAYSHGTQAALAALRTRGVGIFIPNIRGSTGYGKSFYLADIREKRIGAIYDVGLAYQHLAYQSDVDPYAIAIMGGSYGGWMTLEALTRFSKYVLGFGFSMGGFVGGIDTCGVSNYETFLKNTAPSRRKHRALEYGDSVELLAEISPIHKACLLWKPLLMIHGRNDPRVPVSESENMLAEIKKCGGTAAEGLFFGGEGHKIVNIQSRESTTEVVINFLAKLLQIELTPGEGPPAPFKTEEIHVNTQMQ